ncbi:4-hydroxythreonine-4-phosphate dehydrogenase [Acuticoccus sediminis]|uniref:4-hydroxythreonine-4-phosphate dehydrogenase n=1 Tax=Acuticoccus sediminis TaxID=2184697 RepID=A0A8B2NV65_9HYPH|nr:4-hydroxythreonine-4-phosphate dehydrogenase PdxA [Acuticoccus sediminis]RAI02389.1 4-hydroxythreonine-4-phosphate dehydrogenase [Acuticoccus sediminis]
MTDRPLIALALGDPSGIGNELAVKALCHEETFAAADWLVIGDRRLWALGEEQSGLSLTLPDFDPETFDHAAFLDLGHADVDAIAIGDSSEAGGSVAVKNFRTALQLAAAGAADAVTFTPFNKHAMRLADPSYVDEIGFVQRSIGTDAPGSEFNVLDEVWNARVTSHVPLSEVAALITPERIARAIALTDSTMRGAGISNPRIGVAALNPHAGDGGNFGTEDDEIIAPAVEAARLKQFRVTGPVPSDTVYVRALRGEFDAVLTMYHDQGQIAMKLIGFDRGVTLIGGFPFWIATPAHGTAYDIAGSGAANPGAAIKALQLAARLSRRSNPDGFADPVARFAGAAEVLDAARGA